MPASSICTRHKETRFYAHRLKPDSCRFVPGHERVFRYRRICFGARSKIPARAGRRARQEGCEKRHVHCRERQPVPVRLSAGHHVSVAGFGLVGRARVLRSYPPAVRDAALARGLDQRGGRGHRLFHHDHAARGGGRADPQVVRHLRHRALCAVHGWSAYGVLQDYLPHHDPVQRHHQRRGAPDRP